jgi:hypothetical protein
MPELQNDSLHQNGTAGRRQAGRLFFLWLSDDLEIEGEITW